LNPGRVKSKTEKLAAVTSVDIGLQQGWFAQCQYNVTEWGIMFICGMILRCAGTLKPWLESADLTTTVVHTVAIISITDTRR